MANFSLGKGLKGGTVWLGDAVLARMAASAATSIDRATHEAAEDAASNHWWQSQSGDLEGNIIAEPARPQGLRITGKFGSSLRREGFYGLFLERRTPFLRPAADRHFRKLPAFIRERT